MLFVLEPVTAMEVMALAMVVLMTVPHPRRATALLDAGHQAKLPTPS